MFQDLQNAQIQLKYTICTVCDDIVQSFTIMLRRCQARGLHDG